MSCEDPSSPRMRSSRRAVAASLAALTIALAAALWLSLQEPSGPKQRLPDGSELELVGVPSGTTPELRFGNSWQRRALPLIQDRVPSGWFREPAQVPQPVSLSRFWYGSNGVRDLKGRAAFSTGESAAVL